MTAGTAIVVGMASATAASAITQGILISVGKQTEATWIDFVTKGGLACTALLTFAKVVKAMSGL